MPSAYGEACAHILAGCFADEDRDGDAAPIIRTLVQVAGQAELTDGSRVLAERVGLMEPSAGRPLPVADLLRVDGVMPRVQRLIVTRFSLRERIPELSLDVAAAPESVAFEPGVLPSRMEAPALPLPDRDREVGKSFLAEIASGLSRLLSAFSPDTSLELRTAKAELDRGDFVSAAERVVKEIDSGRSRAWLAQESEMAGTILFKAAEQLASMLPGDSPDWVLAATWFKVAAQLLQDHDPTIATKAFTTAGVCFMHTGAPEHAVPMFEHGLELFQAIHDRKAIPWVLLLLGRAKEALHDFYAAQRAYEAAQDAANELADRPMQARMYLELGRLKSEQTQLRDGRHELEQALELYREFDDHEGKAASLVLLGISYLRNLDVDQATSYLSQGLEFWPEKQRAVESDIRIWLGYGRMLMDDWTEGRRELERAMIISQEYGGEEQRARALDALGTIYQVLHDFAGARAMYEAALAASRAAGDEAGQARALNGMGRALRELGDIDGAAVAFETALQIAQDITDVDLLAKTLKGLARLDVWTGEMTRAKALLQQALDLCRDVGERRGEFSTYQALASVLMALGEDAREPLAACTSILANVEIRRARETFRAIEAVQRWPSDPDMSRRIWEEVAEYLQTIHPHEAAPLHALVAIAGGRSLDQVALDLENALGTVHPLPGRVRAAADSDAAIRAIAPFL